LEFQGWQKNKFFLDEDMDEEEKAQYAVYMKKFLSEVFPTHQGMLYITNVIVFGESIERFLIHGRENQRNINDIFSSMK